MAEARVYTVAGADARFATGGALEAEREARAAEDARLSDRVAAVEASPPGVRLEAGRLVLSGEPAVTANGHAGYDVVFSAQLGSVPRVLVAVGKPGTPSGTLVARCGEVTASGFRLWVAGSVSTGWVDWVAVEGGVG